MRAEIALVGFHGTAVMMALAAATVWPRPGQAAQLVPLGDKGMVRVLDWAAREGAPLLELDATGGRVVARIRDERSLFRALGAGILPLAANARDCQPRRTR